MTRSADELWRMLDESAQMPYGAARIAMVEQVIRHADATGDADLAFSARMYGTTAYVYGGEPAKSFVTFAWCLSDFDHNPAPYHQRWRHHLLWYFKYMATALTKFPEVPLARAYAVLDDMERRYREGGHGMQAVYKYRFFVARHVGDQDEADRLYQLWITTPRDDLSDCAGCDPSARVGYLADRHRDEDAIALAEPVLAGRLDCTEQPQGILRGLMVPYLRTGRLDAAADAHRRGYRLVRSNLADLWDIGDHISFCARTGNEHRGLEILQRHIDWLEKAPSPATGMNFAASAVNLLRRLSELGHGDTVVHRRDSGDITVAALADDLAAYATELALRFDARNGTTARSEDIAAKLAAEPFGPALPLSPTARRTPAPERVATPAPQVPADADAATLLDLAEEHEHADRDAAMDATLAVFDQRFPEPAEPRLAARRAMLRGAQRWRAGDVEGAIAAWEQGAAGYGDGPEASTARGRLGVAYLRAHRPDEAAALIEADVVYQDQHGDHRGRSRAHARRAVLRQWQGRLEEALAEQEVADAAARAAGDARLLARCALQRAQQLAALQREAEAAAAAAEAEAFYRAHGPAHRLAGAVLLRARLGDDPEQLVAASTEVLAIGDDDQVLAARVSRGHASLFLERPLEAVTDFVEAVAICAERGLEQTGAHVRVDLANAYRDAGRMAEAAEVGEEAVTWLDRIGDRDDADNARLLLAGIYRRLGVNEDALARYDELVERLTDNPAGRGQIHEYAGDLLSSLDRDAEAADRFAAAAADLRATGDALGEVRVMRRQLLALGWCDRADQALEVAREAAAKHARLSAGPEAVWEGAMLAYETAQLLADRDEPEEALRVLGDAPERLRELGDHDSAAAVERLRATLVDGG